MNILSASDMRACDERTIEQFGVPLQQLMENAGAAVERFAVIHFPGASRIALLCGKGNNGGDGLVAARRLEASGRQVQIVLLAPPDKLEGAPRAAYDQLSPGLKQSTLVVLSEFELASAAFTERVEKAELLVDAVFGTGFRPPLRGVSNALREWVARHSAPLLSVDLPSGWDADSSEPHNPDAFRSSAVVTFTAPKLAHIFGELTRGPIVVAQIGSPQAAIVGSTRLRWAGASKSIIEPPRPLDSNKGRFGHVLVVGGAAGKAGAPAMSSLGAMRAGAGLVTAAVPRSIAGIVSGFSPEVMTVLLDETDQGTVSMSNLDARRSAEMLHGISVLAMGPGLGRTDQTAEFARRLLAETTLPAVLDADGLNAFEGCTDLLDGSGRTLVLTPHPGEMARLLGCTIAEVQRDRIAAAREFSTRHHLTLVLKGWRTLIAHPEGELAVNTSGNPALAKGGSGDVLTGIIAGLLAQFPQRPAQAVEAAVWLHGAAADRFVRQRDQRTMLATELLDHLSAAMRDPVERDGFTWLQEDLR